MSVEKTNENFINFQVPVKLLSEYDSDQDSPTSTPGQSEGPGMSITSSKLKIDTLSKLQRYQDQDQKSETAQGQEFSERYNNSSSGESLEFKHPAGKNDQKYEECDDEDSNNFLTSKNNFTTFTSMKSFNFLKYPTSTNKLPPCFTPVLQRGQSGMSFADSQMEVKRTLERSEQQQKELQAQINTLYKSFNIVKKGDSTQDGENTTLELEEYTEDEEDSGDLNEVLSISSAFERENAQEKVFDLVRKVAKRVLQPSNFEFSKLRVDFKLPSFDPGVDYGQAIEKSKEVYRRLVELKAESSLQKMILEARIEKSENSIKVLKNFSQTRKKNRRFNFEIEKVHNCPFEGCFKKYASEISLSYHMRSKHNSVNKVKRTQFIYEVFDQYKKDRTLLHPKSFNLPKIYMNFMKEHLENLESFDDYERNQFVLAIKKEVELYIRTPKMRPELAVEDKC